MGLEVGVIVAIASTVVSIATTALSYLLAPKPKGQNSQTRGPQETEFRLNGSDYGAAIPLIFGLGKLPGNLVWKSSVREVQRTTTYRSSSGSGKNKVTNSQTQVTYEYYVDFVVQVCQGPMVGVSKIWFDKQLVYARRAGEDSVDLKTGTVSIYLGTSIQTLPSPVPTSYRDTVVLHFENVNISPFGNRLPLVEIEVCGKGTVAPVTGLITPAPVSATEIITGLATKAGVLEAELSIADITAEFDGFITPSGTIFGALQQIVDASQAVSIYSDDQLKFRTRISDSIVTIDAGDLRYSDDDNEQESALQITRVDEKTLPSSLTIAYVDATRNHDQNNQTSKLEAEPRFLNESVLNLNIAMSADHAARLGDILLYSAWQQRVTYNFSLGPKFLYLEPGDVVTVDTDDGTATIFINQIEYGANAVLKLNGSSYNKYTFSSARTGGTYVVEPVTIKNPTATQFQFFNAPMITDEHNKPGVYVFANGAVPSSWYYADAYLSYNAVDYLFYFGLVQRGIFGTASNALEDAPAQLIDYINHIDIVINHGVLYSETLADLLADNTLNLFFIGDELVQAADVDLVDVNTYRLSTLLRGRFGTEHYTGSHSIGEKIGYYPTATFMTLNENTSYLTTLYFKFVSNKQAFDDVFTVYSLISDFRTLIPYSPIDVDAVLAGSDVVITWLRRSRSGQELGTTGTEVLLFEASERYEIDIINGLDLVVRTLSATTETATYTLAQQVTDFGGAVSSIKCRVYQLSETVGRGTPSELLNKSL